jgi:hypothetical protein
MTTLNFTAPVAKSPMIRAGKNIDSGGFSGDDQPQGFRETFSVARKTRFTWRHALVRH